MTYEQWIVNASAFLVTSHHVLGELTLQNVNMTIFDSEYFWVCHIGVQVRFGSRVTLVVVNLDPKRDEEEKVSLS